MAEKKPHCVTVSIVSESDGFTNQEIICKEYAYTSQELVTKNMTIALAVVEAVTASMATLAENQGLELPGTDNRRG